MKKKKFSLRNILLWGFTLLFVIYAITHRNELDKVIRVLASGSYKWLFAALVAQVIQYLTFTLMTQSAFKTVDMKRKVSDLIPLVLGSLFVNVLAPTAGNSGTILFADDAARRKESSTKAVIGYLVSVVSSYTSFSLILIFSILYLKSQNLLDTFEIIGALIFVLPATIPTTLILFASKKPIFLTKSLSGFYKIYLKFCRIFKKKDRLGEKWPVKITDEMEEASVSIISNIKVVSITLIYALLAHAINILSLYFIFISFDIHVRYGALIAGYAFAEVVRVISPQPEGVGVVEAVMILLYTSFGVPPIDATAIAVTFRTLNFWIPLGLGFLYLRGLKSFKSID